MFKRHVALLVVLLSALSLALTACGGRPGPSAEPPLTWEAGEALRWARLNPCACLSSDEHVTSVELRPLAVGEGSDDEPQEGPQEGAGALWERVALPRPLSPETQAALTLLQEAQGRPVKLQSDLSSLAVSLKSHRVRLLTRLAPPQREEEQPEGEPNGEPTTPPP
jgi:hypothetical protein